MELLHQSGDTIAQRYQILSFLGRGGFSTTYLAQDLQNHQQVALKALSLQRITDWKTLELFEREARILAQLNHPAIPQYLDYFEIDLPEDSTQEHFASRTFYIVQQLAQGRSLAKWIETDWHPSEDEVQSIAAQILDVLIYLHELSPPVIHRDIKPQNIIRAEDGQLFLVDFGSVQDTYRNTLTQGSTIVGTYGYMAPEQFRGQAVLATDLYGLGTTLLFLLTGDSPATLPQRRLKIDFRPHVQISKSFAAWLERLLEPIAENRFASARIALAVLKGESPPDHKLHKPYRQKGNRITLTRDEDCLVLEIPPAWLSSSRGKWTAITIGMSFLTLPLYYLGIEYIYGGTYGTYWSGALYLIGLSVFLFLVSGALDTVSRTQLEINQDRFRFQQWLLGWRYRDVQKQIGGSNPVELMGIRSKQTAIASSCKIRVGKHQYPFGYGLTQWEYRLLIEEVSEFWQSVSSKVVIPTRVLERNSHMREIGDRLELFG
jgi:eukaryotic-like serine/threonine-protein kinase